MANKFDKLGKAYPKHGQLQRSASQKLKIWLPKAEFDKFTRAYPELGPLKKGAHNEKGINT